MSVNRMEAPELLGLDKFNVDEEEAHIVLDKALCRQCRERACLVVCPAVLYKLDRNGDMSFDCAGCLECGTCRIMCRGGGIVRWEYPRSGLGVSYRFG